MNYDLVPVVGSLSFFICPTYYTHIHTRIIILRYILYIMCSIHRWGDGSEHEEGFTQYPLEKKLPRFTAEQWIRSFLPRSRFRR